MSECFDERVAYAVKTLWIDRIPENAAEAKRRLEEAAAEGNGDACYFLARCYFGPSFVDPAFGFEDDDALGYAYLDKSLELGSAVGMFASMRVGGYKPRTGSFVNPPYHSLKEIWDVVEKMGQEGELFCEYMIANAYYFGDILDFFEIDPKTIDLNMVQGWKYKAAAMYENCIKHGMGLCIQNLINIITSGEYGIPKNEKRASELRRIGADMHIGRFERLVGEECEETDPNKALELYKRAVTHGDAEAYYRLGKLYTFKGRMPQDLKRAKEYFELCLKENPESIGSKNLLGEILFYGGEGIEPDYNRAFAYFKETRVENKWCSDMLGTCYLRGLGTPVNYEAARKEFEVYKKEPLSAIGLGEIYCYGLGVPQNIKLGMEYFDRFPDHPRVIENKRKFKKTLFGWKYIG